MKVKAPEGVSGINIGGQQFNADDTGHITLPDDGHYPLPAGYERVEEVAQSPSASAHDE